MTIRDMFMGYAEIDFDWMVYTSDPDGYCEDVYSTFKDMKYPKEYIPQEIMNWSIDYCVIDNIVEQDGIKYPAMIIAHDIGYGNEW